MRILCVVVLLSATMMLAQDSEPANSQTSKSNGEVTITGCVSRSSGDYILMKTDPAVSYELQATGKTRLKHYLGQRVEVTGTTSPTLSSSSDAMAKMGSAAPVTLTISSIRMIAKDCTDPAAK